MTDPMKQQDSELGETAKAMRVTFDVSQLFPLDDPLSIPLLRLMIAVDDARHLQKLILMATTTVKDNQTERAIHEGEMGHLFRLLCGHLYEAGLVFRRLSSDRKFSARLDMAVSCDEQAKVALERVREAYRKHDENDNEQGFWYSFLRPVRQYIGFHYKDEKLRDSLAKHQHSEYFSGSLALVEFSGLSRYTVADSLVKLVIADAVGGGLVSYLRTYPDHMKQAIKLAGALAEVTDLLLNHLFDLHPEVELEQVEEVIPIPTWLRGAKRNADNTTQGGDDGATR